ncbi:hypothetical protein IKG16_00060, partial [Candidatus Saccharibacteria bacterium]|nr:hypothetical protein [Candidatus Saccharibacteria bacterium]
MRKIISKKIFIPYATISVAFLFTLLFSISIFPIESTFATPLDPSSPSVVSGSSTSPVSVSVSNSPLSYYISVSSSHGSAGTPVSLSYSQDGSSGGTLGNVVSSSDNVYLETNSPMVHQLLLSTSGTHTESTIPSSLVANNLTGTNTQETGGSLITNTYIAPIGNTTTSSLSSASALSPNTWGFALASTTPGIVT